MHGILVTIVVGPPILIVLVLAALFLWHAYVEEGLFAGLCLTAVYVWVAAFAALTYPR